MTREAALEFLSDIVEHYMDFVGSAYDEDDASEVEGQVMEMREILGIR